MHSCQLCARVTRRQIGAAVVALPAIIGRPAKAAQTITLAGAGGWFENDFDTTILEAFRKAHPNIRVFYYPVGNAFQMLALLRSERAYPSTDVMLMEAAVAARATAEGLFEPLTPDAMPIMKDLVQQAILPAVAGPALMLDSLALGYSPGQVTRDPHSWRDLWDAAYGRRIAMQTPPDPLGLAITAVAAALFGGGSPRNSLEIAMTALTQLAPRVALWNPVPDVYSAIAAGDADIGPCWNARAQSQLTHSQLAQRQAEQSQAGPSKPGQNQMTSTQQRFAATIPIEGSPFLATTVNLVKGTPQADAARILIAWLLSPEAQRLLTETMFYAPVNARTEIAAASLLRAGATPALVDRRMEMDWIAVTAIRDQITAAWRGRNLANH